MSAAIEASVEGVPAIGFSLLTIVGKQISILLKKL